MHNLIKLRNYLDKLPEDYKHFNMGSWVSADGEDLGPEELSGIGVESCGYVACAVGHAPEALGLSIEELNDINSWDEFIRKYFGLTFKEEDWLFGVEWEKVDNTPKGVVARINYFLEDKPLPSYLQDKKESRKLYKLLDK